MKPKYFIVTKNGHGLFSIGGATYEEHTRTTLFDSVDAVKAYAVKMGYKDYSVCTFVMDVEQVPRYDLKVTEYSI